MEVLRDLPNIWGTELACNENSERCKSKESEDDPALSKMRSESRLHGMEHFDAKQIQMSTTKHLALQKFEPVHLSLCDPVILRTRESRVNCRRVSTNAIGQAVLYSFMAVEVRGRNLREVRQAIQQSCCEFIQEYHENEFPPPGKDDPVIESIQFITGDKLDNILSAYKASKEARRNA
jgi:hypothetical protein